MQVVAKALARGGEAELVELMARFRSAFVDALQPRFLSPAWQIGHRWALPYMGCFRLSSPSQWDTSIRRK